MYWQKLLSKSKIFYNNNPQRIKDLKFSGIFKDGAAWMSARLQEIRGFHKDEYYKPVPYSFYGVLKYAILLFFFLMAVLILGSMSVFLIPLSALIFYFVEVHFLFLFPLLIDEVNKPISKSLKLTYKVGVFKCFSNVIPISIFMVIGLMNFKNPFRNWYIGCLCILFWYEEAIGNRI